MARGQPKPEPSLHADVVRDAGDWSAVGDAEGLIAQATAAVAAHEGLLSAPSAVTVALSDDTSVAELNARYRGKPKPTNVLSFPAGPGAEAGHFGDIVLASETVLREADEQGITPAHHLQHLTVHGILHLLGFDHERTDDAERMESLEIMILGRLGIANPYTGALEAGTKGATGEPPAPSGS